MLLATVSQAPYCRGGVRQAIGERIATLFLRFDISVLIHPAFRGFSLIRQKLSEVGANHRFGEFPSFSQNLAEQPLATRFLSRTADTVPFLAGGSARQNPAGKCGAGGPFPWVIFDGCKNILFERAQLSRGSNAASKIPKIVSTNLSGVNGFGRHA